MSNSGVNNAAIRSANNIVLAASTLGANLAVTAGGSISQTGALIVPGSSSFTVDTAGAKNILLASADN
ncbi:hypothetical protein ACVBEH_30195, partial [Roseateles sp. GG27B]